jgi:hypothetical protein
MNNMAKDLGGEVIFYTGEEAMTLKTQGVIKEKIDSKQEFLGIIFFRIHQFNYGKSFNFKLLQLILKMKYEVHFAQENISLYTIDDLKKNFSMFSIFEKINSNHGCLNLNAIEPIGFLD